MNWLVEYTTVDENGVDTQVNTLYEEQSWFEFMYFLARELNDKNVVRLTVENYDK